MFEKLVLGSLLHILGFKHAIREMDDRQIEAFLKEQMPGVLLQDFIGLAPSFSTNYVRDKSEEYVVEEKNGE